VKGSSGAISLPSLEMRHVVAYTCVDDRGSVAQTIRTIDVR